jgi:preprotein translocase subunit SecA
VLALASNKEEQTLKKATLQNYFKEQPDVVGCTLSEATQVYRLPVLEALMACGIPLHKIRRL